MEKNVLKAIRELSLLPEGTKVVTVALSGGADSMSLLYCLLGLKDKLEISVEAAHLNHQIRGEEALNDERFVTEICDKLGVVLHKKSVDIPLVAKEKGISTELAARQERYKFLNSVNKGVVATAHNANDNLETMIFNLARGTGLEGLCGIPPKRDIYIRPLIYCTREEIEKYCFKNNISYVTDSTNLSDDYTRNKIRHNIIPVLKEINPLAEKVALRTSLSLREDSFEFKSRADEYINSNKNDNGLSVKDFSSISVPVAKRIIKTYIENEVDINLESVHISSIYETVLNTGRIGIPSDYMVEVKNNNLRIFNKNDEKPNFSVKIEQEIKFDYENTKKINNLLLNSLLDCDKIVGKLVVRNRISGDSMRKLNSGCTKSLSKLLNECQVPAEIRDNIPVIADDIGVVWVWGVGVCQRCAVNKKTKKAFKIEAQKY